MLLTETVENTIVNAYIVSLRRNKWILLSKHYHLPPLPSPFKEDKM